MAIPNNKSPVASKTRSAASKRNIELISPIRKVRNSKKRNKDLSSSSRKKDASTSTPAKIPVLHYKGRDSPIDLDSSPIKRNQDYSTPPSPEIVNLTSSSPIKKKKCVAFSDELFSDLPVTPEKVPTPSRPILKYYNINSNSSPVDPNNTALWEKSSEQKAYGPKNPSFWLQGTIIQLQPNSSELAYLIEGCLDVLGDHAFKRRFEVYATLNGICKSNPRETLVRLFASTPSGLTTPSKVSPKSVQESSTVVRLASQIRKDIESTENQLFDSDIDKENVSPSKNDPFRIRIINQALKLVNFFMSDQDLNNFLPVDDISWFYRHACMMLRHPQTSKAIVSPYLLIIKDCKFSVKKKRLVFDNSDIPENMLYSLINMKPFLSASIVTEKFLCFKNFVLNFPIIMAKNVAHWFGFLIWNIFDVTSPFYLKCLGVGINCLLVVAKTFLDNKNVSLFVRQFLSSDLPANFNPSSEGQTEPSNLKTIDMITKKLEELILSRQYKCVMDMWLAFTLLVADGESSFDKWEYLNKWLQIPKYCFNSQDENARLLVLGSWKAIAFNVCRNELNDMKRALDPIFKIPNLKERPQAISVALKSKARLLTYLFASFNAAEVQNEVVDAMHNLFICILYLIINPQIMKSSTKYMHIYWDKIIQVVFLNFYFKKGTSTPHMNQLGLKILTRLLRPATPINERNFNEVRCLSTDPVLLTEINSLPPRWVHAKFDRIMHNMVHVFQSDNLYIEQKVNFFNAFLASIRSITKNEVSVSAATYDIIDNIPVVLGVLFESNKFTYDLALKLVLNLHDTFDPSLLVNRTRYENGEISTNVYLSLFQNCLPRLTNEESMELFSLIIQSLTSQKVLIFIADLCKLELNDGVRNMFIDVLNKRKVETTESELGLYNEVCGNFHSGFDIFVKKLIQSIVSLSDSEELKRCLSYIKFDSWTIDIRMYFLLLVKGAPNVHVQQYTISVLEKQLKDQDALPIMVQFLTEQNFDIEIGALVAQIVKAVVSAAESVQPYAVQALHNYLLVKSKDLEPNVALLDELMLSCYTELNMDIARYLTLDLTNFPLLAEEFSKRGVTCTNGELTRVNQDSDTLIDPVRKNTVQPVLDVDVNEHSVIWAEDTEQLEAVVEPVKESLVANNEDEPKQVLKEQVIAEAGEISRMAVDENTTEISTNESEVVVEISDSIPSTGNVSKKEELDVEVSDCSIVPASDSERKKTLDLEKTNVVVSNEKEETPDVIIIIPDEDVKVSQGTRSKKKEKIKGKGKGRKKKSTRAKKEIDSDSVSISEAPASEDSSFIDSKESNFDVHAFTALVNAKLDSKTSKDAVEEVNKSNSEISFNEPVPKVSLDSIISSNDVPERKRKLDGEYVEINKKSRLSEQNDDGAGVEPQLSNGHSETVFISSNEESITLVDAENSAEKVLFSTPSLDLDSEKVREPDTFVSQESCETLSTREVSLVEKGSVADLPMNDLVSTEISTVSELQNDSTVVVSSHVIPAAAADDDDDDEFSSISKVVEESNNVDAIQEQVSSVSSTEIAIIENSQDTVLQNKENVISSLIGQLQDISDEEISNLSVQKKYDIETQLLGLMLRLRNSR
ncbi:uncharacterized protein SPAPADRAFT_48346 [Spathaspora passalidarum NRRL Y-27907]|uniref:Telomere-associated protein Rif1 N-terminal domain-containing protein n=1 Tax=Spathaspora passalidarum (strain NRRL Y-27907 / 11-Y1) TaxID=619300 RepID=G3AGK2_SPAPN|nr:uncharacterized protein SPAPADRAFT_48346 [Spathaspora passalidarum NRRL Y-27907]EGW35341.1 hypothetical protein SPAPADRAFT_48346 [Spathaspora passalidarum NRRL Y-27907]